MMGFRWELFVVKSSDIVLRAHARHIRGNQVGRADRLLPSGVCPSRELKGPLRNVLEEGRQN